MLSRKRPRVSSATGTWTPRKKARTNSRALIGSSGLRTGGWRGVPGRRGELKYVDVTIAPVVTSSTGTLYLLNGLVPGTGASQRIGKKAVMKSIQFRCATAGGLAGANPFQGFIRYLWVYDRQTNATAPNVTTVLEVATGFSMMNMDNRDRFLVLADRQYSIDQSGGNQSSNFKMYKKINLPTIFNAGTAGTVADITSGALYLLVISDQGYTALQTNNPSFSAYHRIRYDDS